MTSANSIGPTGSLTIGLKREFATMGEKSEAASGPLLEALIFFPSRVSFLNEIKFFWRRPVWKFLRAMTLASFQTHILIPCEAFFTVKIKPRLFKETEREREIRKSFKVWERHWEKSTILPKENVYWSTLPKERERVMVFSTQKRERVMFYST